MSKNDAKYLFFLCLFCVVFGVGAIWLIQHQQAPLRAEAAECERRGGAPVIMWGGKVACVSRMPSVPASTDLTLDAAPTVLMGGVNPEGNAAVILVDKRGYVYANCGTDLR